MKKGSLSTFFLIVVLLIGLSLLLYPSFSDYWNSKQQSYAVATYVEKVSNMSEDQYKELWDAAIEYNKSLLKRENEYVLNEEQKALYNKLLSIDGDPIMGYVDIPSIGVYLPLYHGTDESALQVAIGHLEWTSLPTGGAGTHCSVSGHRGLPSAKLFTDLDQLTAGDYFMINVLDKVFTYEVDQIHIVEPHDVSHLLIEEGKDLCTLVTCTPYGVNSHRLLVRGHRVDNLKQAQTVRVTADAFIIERLVVAPFVLMPILVIMITFMLTTGKKENRRRRRKM